MGGFADGWDLTVRKVPKAAGCAAVARAPRRSRPCRTCRRSGRIELGTRQQEYPASDGRCWTVLCIHLYPSISVYPLVKVLGAETCGHLTHAPAGE